VRDVGVWQTRISQLGPRRRGLTLAVMIAGVLALGAGAMPAAAAKRPTVTVVSAFPGHTGHRKTTSSGKKGLHLGQAECSSAAGAWCYYALINDTPYTMTLVYTNAWFTEFGKTYGTPFNVAPASTLQPGQKTVFGFEEGEAWDSWVAANIHYEFTDVNGNKHRCDYNIDLSGNPSTLSIDEAPDGSIQEATDVFYMRKDPDNYPNDFDAVLSQPAVATVDAKTDPARAAAVMRMWSTGTNKSYTPTTGLTFSTGPFHRVSALVENTSNEQATLDLGYNDEEDETTSLELDVGWTSTLDILGFANEQISATVTGGHSWTTGISQGQTFDVIVDPGHVGWIQAATTSATVTGDFAFTNPVGIIYKVLNASITEPGYGPTGPVGAITYEPAEQPIGSLGHSKPGTVKASKKASKPKPKCSRVGGGPKAAHCPATPPTSHCARFKGKVGKTPACASWLTTATANTVVIDAKSDPKDAASAMALFPGASDKSFMPTSNPIYTNTDQAVESNPYQVPTSYAHSVPTGLSATQSSASSWSIGGMVSSETTLSILGFANASVTVTFSASHEWVNTHSVSQTVTATVDPGYIDWIEGYTRQVTFTGDYSFTANGVSYQVNNVSITEPGNSELGPEAAPTYIVISHKLNQLKLGSNPKPGYTQPTSIPKLTAST
jgi:hypothetical protein